MREKNKKFWNWARDADENGGRVLYLDRVIAEDTWYGDEVTPRLFREELLSAEGDITVFLNSIGGDCVAASQIYTMLTDYPHHVTVKIDGIAASAASVIAMAGTRVLMAPTALMMCHNPFTVAIGDSEEMKKAIGMLAEVKESIINAYHAKTGQPREKISRWMDAETWMNVNRAMELGFADGVLEDKKRGQSAAAYAFSRRAVTSSLLGKVLPKISAPEPEEEHLVQKPAGASEGKENQTTAPTGTPHKELLTRLNLLK